MELRAWNSFFLSEIHYTNLNFVKNWSIYVSIFFKYGTLFSNEFEYLCLVL